MRPPSSVRYLSKEELHEQIKAFWRGMSVTSSSFEIIVAGRLADMEWNQMDQQHRPFVHRTYQKGIRICTGRDFASSVTQWGKWPFFITVNDARVAPGLYYQSMSLGGLFFLHSIISMTEENGHVRMLDEWYLASHWLFRPLHRPLSRKLLALHVRLNSEDAAIRAQRYALRQKGYEFRSDPPDFLNANSMQNNTIYPTVAGRMIDIASIPDHGLIARQLGDGEFLIAREPGGIIKIWPAACPHEGGPLVQGKLCDAGIDCPWHGLRFAPVRLGPTRREASAYGYTYRIEDQTLWVSMASPCTASGLTQEIGVT